MASSIGRLSTKRRVRRVVGKVSPSGVLVLGDGASFPDQKHGEVLVKAQALPSDLTCVYHWTPSFVVSHKSVVRWMGTRGVVPQFLVQTRRWRWNSRGRSPCEGSQTRRPNLRFPSARSPFPVPIHVLSKKSIPAQYSAILLNTSLTRGGRWHRSTLLGRRISPCTSSQTCSLAKRVFQRKYGRDLRDPDGHHCHSSSSAVVVANIY